MTLRAVRAELAELRASMARLQADFTRAFDRLHLDVSALFPHGALAQIAAAPGARVTSSGPPVDPLFPPGNVLSGSRASFFRSEDAPNQWVQFELPAKAVRPLSYEIRSADLPPGSVHPRSWVIEGSAEGRNWVEIDRRDDTDELNGSYRIERFTVNCADAFHVIRFRQVNVNHFGNHTFAFAGFEVFGLTTDYSVLPPPHPPPPLDSRIIDDLPEIQQMFLGLNLQLLWRGTRDGFAATEFHRRCDGHSNTLTVVLTTRGFVLGGFTPLAWESRMESSQARGKQLLHGGSKSREFSFQSEKSQRRCPAYFPDSAVTEAICDLLCIDRRTSVWGRSRSLCHGPVQREG
jgi:hypothetical protein